MTLANDVKKLEEALEFSSASLPSRASTSSSSKLPIDSRKLPERYCDICTDRKTESEMFRNTNVCGHMFCFDCIREHVAVKIKENMVNVRCPDPSCKGLIRPEVCRFFVPREVIIRWEKALCESMIIGSQKFYCPFKDCSALLVDDGGLSVTSSECPNCNRLFCAQCKVAWHAGIDCRQFQMVIKGEIDPTDIWLMNLAKTKNWRRCPKCSFYVEKTEGCLHISCRCGYQFCYGCGMEYHRRHECPPKAGTWPCNLSRKCVVLIRQVEYVLISCRLWWYVQKDVGDKLQIKDRSTSDVAAGSSSSTGPSHNVDAFDFEAFLNQDEKSPISHKEYIEEMELQEALMMSSSSSTDDLPFFPYSSADYAMSSSTNLPFIPYVTYKSSQVPDKF
ncbi:zinc finger, C6HC-type containing protein [Tanacetum coccineum]